MPDRRPADCRSGAREACSAAPACPAALPPRGVERAAILVLRFLAAARETGDACCWDAALDHAEAAFGERGGPLVVGHAGALIRRLGRSGVAIDFLPPPCRLLSAGETLLVGALAPRAVACHGPAFGPAGEHVAALARVIAQTDRSARRQAA